MSVSSEIETVISILRSYRERTRALKTVDEFRLAEEELMSRFRLAEDISYERIGAGGVPAEWVVAPGAAEDRVILYLHGGAYMLGSVRTYRVTLSRLSRAAGARVLGLDYRLSPENPFPAPVEDSTAAYRWLLSSGADPGKIVIAGDSAGGGLTLATLVALRYLGEPMPAAGVCISPWADLAQTGGSMTTKAGVDPLVQREGLQARARVYLGGRDPRTPLASPLYADLHGLPPLLIQVGSSETLLDDSTRVAESARASGVDVTLEVWDDMVHLWQAFAPILREGQQAMEHSGEFIRKHTT